MKNNDINLTYDVVCSLGERCTTAHQMRLNKLRSQSNPFDWIITEDITQVVNTILDNFSHFFDKENIIITGSNKEHLIIKDLSTGFRSPHDIKINSDFDFEYDEFKAKCTHRISRFVNQLQTASSILFIRTNADENDINELIKLTAVNTNARIDFLIINLTETDHVNELPSQHPNVTVFEISQIPDLPSDPWMGNHAHWRKVLSKYSLKNYEDFLVNQIKQYSKNKPIVLWGFGGAGRKIHTHLLTNSPDINIAWIVDNNPDKWGNINESLIIQGSNSLLNREKEVWVLICIYGDTLCIENQLKDMNYPPDSFKHIVYDGLNPVGIKKNIFI